MTESPASALPPVRLARAEDAPRLAALAERTSRDAFGPFNTTSDMDLHCSLAYGPAIVERALEDPDSQTFVVENGSDLIGYARLRFGSAPECVRAAAPSELQRLYVLSAWHGSGLAAALMNAVTDRASAGGADVLWLGVWERNPRAIRFYERCGFREIGEQRFVLGTDPQRDLVMAMPLQAARRGKDPR